LAEAKCYDRNVGLDVLQSFVGVVKDISENYFVPEGLTSEQRLKFKRYTDCGAIFSSSGFSPNAQDFALAHGINLVSYENVAHGFSGWKHGRVKTEIMLSHIGA
jgi:hypothetical protein